MDDIQKISELIALDLKKGIKKKGSSTFIVSGGKSPLPIFFKLRELDLGWKNIKVSLVDERILPSDHKDSNERNVKTNLLKKFAEEAQFISLSKNKTKLMKLNRPYDVMLLGVGQEDGHFASLFPNMISSKSAFDKNSSPEIIKTQKNGLPYCPRLTMNLAMILQTLRCIIIANSEKKMRIVSKAFKDNTIPLYYLLNNKMIDVEIYESE
tara:strand:+ start:408 stop:1037 length:630 start_codon:yes stop_codon:yes gene_type:complete